MSRGTIFIVLIGSFLLIPIQTFGQSSGEKEIYYRNQRSADVDLMNFDKGNPSCQLWTNWQKMCSRTGADGTTNCQVAQNRLIRPSLPFCLARTDEPLTTPSARDEPGQMKSLLRFCQNRHNLDPNDPEVVAKCLWDIKRPFSGYNLAELSHPWCARWRRLPEKGKATQLWCSVRSVPDWCVWPEGLGYGPLDSDAIASGHVEIGQVVPDPNSLPINGIYCRRRLSNAPK